MKKGERTKEKLVEAALERSAQRVIERAIQTGTPVITWVDGAVRAVDPVELLKKPRLKKIRRLIEKIGRKG